MDGLVCCVSTVFAGGVGGTCGETECDVQVGIWLYVGTLLYVAVIYS